MIGNLFSIQDTDPLQALTRQITSSSICTNPSVLFQNILQEASEQDKFSDSVGKNQHRHYPQSLNSDLRRLEKIGVSEKDLDILAKSLLMENKDRLEDRFRLSGHSLELFKTSIKNAGWSSSSFDETLNSVRDKNGNIWLDDAISEVEKEKARNRDHGREHNSNPRLINILMGPGLQPNNLNSLNMTGQYGNVDLKKLANDLNKYIENQNSFSDSKISSEKVNAFLQHILGDSMGLSSLKELGIKPNAGYTLPEFQALIEKLAQGQVSGGINNTGSPGSTANGSQNNFLLSGGIFDALTPSGTEASPLEGVLNEASLSDLQELLNNYLMSSMKQNTSGAINPSFFSYSFSQSMNNPFQSVFSAYPNAPSGEVPLLMSSSFIDQLANQISRMISGGREQLVIGLQPPDLGKLRILVKVHDGNVETLIQATRAEAKQLLDGGSQQLRQMLEQNGLSLGQFKVALLPDVPSPKESWVFNWDHNPRENHPQDQREKQGFSNRPHHQMRFDQQLNIIT